MLNLFRSNPVKYLRAVTVASDELVFVRNSSRYPLDFGDEVYVTQHGNDLVIVAAKSTVQEIKVRIIEQLPEPKSAVLSLATLDD